MVGTGDIGQFGKFGSSVGAGGMDSEEARALSSGTWLFPAELALALHDRLAFEVPADLPV